MALQLLKERSDLRNVVSASTVISACAKVGRIFREIETGFSIQLVFAWPGPGDRDRFVLAARLARRSL